MAELQIKDLFKTPLSSNLLAEWMNDKMMKPPSSEEFMSPNELTLGTEESKEEEKPKSPTPTKQSNRLQKKLKIVLKPPPSSPSEPSELRRSKRKRKRKELKDEITFHISSPSSPTGPIDSPASSPASSPSSNLSSPSSTSSSLNQTCRYSTCMICPLSKEIIYSLTWRDIILLCFKALHRTDPEHGTWLHIPSEIFAYMEDHLEVLWGSGRKSVDNWKKRIHDTLCHNKDIFESGKDAIPEKRGWWNLTEMGIKSEVIFNKETVSKFKALPSTPSPKVTKARKQRKKSTFASPRTRSRTVTSESSLQLVDEDLEFLEEEETEEEEGDEVEIEEEEEADSSVESEGSDDENTKESSTVSSNSAILTPTWRLVSDYEQVMSSLPEFQMPVSYITSSFNLATTYKELYDKLHPRRGFWDRLHLSLAKQSNPIGTYPYVGNYPVDLYSLYEMVISYGGYHSISTINKKPVEWSDQWEKVFCKLVVHKDPPYDPCKEQLPPLGDLRWRRLKLKNIYEIYLLNFEEELNSAAPQTFSPPKSSEIKANFVRCVCGHSHLGATSDVDCVTCKIESEARKCSFDHIQCEACGCWQHIQCLLNEYVIEETELSLLSNPEFHYYCEMCTESRQSVEFSKKVLQVELPLLWTCERKWKGRVQKHFDFFFFPPGQQLLGQKGKNSIKSHSELMESLQNAQKQQKQRQNRSKSS